MKVEILHFTEASVLEQLLTLIVFPPMQRVEAYYGLGSMASWYSGVGDAVNDLVCLFVLAELALVDRLKVTW